MFAKIFTQIFDSSLAENYQVRFVFEDMLKLANIDGVVDMTHEAISRRTNVPLEIVKQGIAELEKPDPRSRNSDHEGRRIIRLDDHRDWGWFIVNYEHYRSIRDDDQRRLQNRESQARFRSKHKSATVSKDKLRKPKKAHAEAEAEADVKEDGANESHPAPKLSEEDWRKSVAAEPAYKHINVSAEFSKLIRWCEVNRKQPTRKRFINWLNRIEPPFKAAPASRTVRGESAPAQRPADLTPEQIAKNKAVIGPLMADLTAKLTGQVGNPS